MKILIWNSKHDNVLVCARSIEEEKRAWLYLFKCMDDNGFYCDLDEDEAMAYKFAKKGDAVDARWLLEMRSGCEYERVRVETPVEP